MTLSSISSSIEHQVLPLHELHMPQLRDNNLFSIHSRYLALSLVGIWKIREEDVTRIRPIVEAKSHNVSLKFISAQFPVKFPLSHQPYLMVKKIYPFYTWYYRRWKLSML